MYNRLKKEDSQEPEVTLYVCDFSSSTLRLHPVSSWR